MIEPKATATEIELVSPRLTYPKPNQSSQQISKRTDKLQWIKGQHGYEERRLSI